MEPFISDEDFTLYNGDALGVLRTLPDESVHCCLTSPPYWELRDYGADGQLGLESTPEEYVQNMVEVFREVRRVLRPDGTCWLNLGDSYASSPPGNKATGLETWASSGLHGAVTSERYAATLDASVSQKMNTVVGGLKPKDLVGIPWRVAFALQADGWYLRSDVIWAKPNPMPESVTDRPTKAHEYVFLLSKSPRYFFDQEAVREGFKYDGRNVLEREAGPGSHGNHRNGKRNRWPGLNPVTWEERKAAGATRGNLAFGDNIGAGTQRGVHGEGVSHDLGNPVAGRNIRSVWEIATQPYSEAHFATFPEALVDRIIRASCPEGGTCLDPFIGSGTTALVARRLGRKTIGIELNLEYCEMAARRTRQLSLLA